MAFVTAIKTDLRNEILRILKQDITFLVSPNDVNKTIATSAIVLQKTRAQVNRQDIQSNQNIDVPGILVCSPLRTPIPPSEWTNEKDEWHYFWMLQLVDSDLWSETDRLDTWEKWVEQIMSKFMFNCLNAAVQLPKAVVIATTANEVQDIDERRWVRDGKFIAGIELEVRVAQPRGTIV